MVLALLSRAVLAEDNRCSPDGTFRTRVILAAAPWREGTLLAESCQVDAKTPAPSDWQRVVFIRNDGGVAWSRPLGAQVVGGAVWWSTLTLVPKDVDADLREEVILHGTLANCGAGSCVSGTARMYLWPDVPDSGGDCGRPGFEEGQRARLLIWENARFEGPGWAGPSWIRSTVGLASPGQLAVREQWTALPPSAHDVINYETRVSIGPLGVLPHCPGVNVPGL